MTTPTPRSVFVVGDGEGDCLFASGVEQYAKDHFQLCVDEANDFRTGPYTLTEYVPKRDLAARDVELKAIAHHVGGGAFYRDEHGGRLPMRDQVGQHIAELNQQLAARDAELAAMKQRAEEYWRERDAARDHADHEQRRANRAEERAVAAEQERDSAVSWNHRVSVCEKHTAEIVDGPCVICELEAAERKAEEAAMELQMRRTPLNAPGDEELIRQSGIQLRHCSCSGGSGDEAHADGCPLWLDVLAARQWWRDRHVVAWSCSREAKGGNRCAQWCGHQQYCNAHTRDDIEIAAIAAKGDA